MATDLRRAKSTPASKYDSFVSAQLARAENRIRLLDLMAGLLGCAALGLAYIVAMVLCDSKLMLSQETRQMALYLFLAGGTAYLFHVVVRPLRLRVNPYYAARLVEQQLPQAKNSIVNWVDLHEQQLPPAIRGALGQRAAKDMSRVDVERAISGRRAAWMGGFVALLAIAFIVLFFLLGPAPFLSLLKRTFNPFGSGGVSTRTQLTILKPEGGNAAVTVGRGINFVVDVNGKVPDPKAADAVKLLYRYEEGDPWLERRLIQEPSREWTTSLSAIEVRNGFWYKITGGDATTEEYQVAVRAAPAITDFLATYHFRPYVARPDEVHRERELKALRGTEVLLRVRTNRPLRDGRLEFEGKGGSVRGEVDPNEPHTLFLRFILEEDSKYRFFFTSTESEAYTDAAAYSVTAILDQPPLVELTKPGQDISLPADALLHLEGKASDDIGVKTLTLQMRVVGGQKLRGQPYRGADALRLADGGYPAEVEYEDFVELSRVQDEMGQAVALRAGMELEYWLEASDACDYPHPNVVASKHYRVLFTKPEKNAQKSRREKQQAAENKKQHDQKQDQKLREENKDRQQQRKEQEARNQEEENKSKDVDKGSAGDPSQSKEGGQQNDGASTDNNGQKGESKDGSNQPNNGGQKGESSAEDQKIEDQIKKALERKQASDDAKSEAKPDKGEDKGAQPDKSEGSDKAGSKSEGGNKGADKQDAKEPGEGKDNGEPKAGADPAQAEGKGDKQANPAPDAKSEPKDGDPRKKDGAGAARESKGKSDASPSSSEGKPSADPQASKDTAEGKSPPKGKDQDEASKSKDKDKPQAGSAPPKDGKGGNQADPMPGDKSEPKDGDTKKQKGAGEERESKGKSDAEHRSDQDKGKSDAGRPSSEGKPNGDPRGSKDAAEAKSQPKGKDQNAAGDSKPRAGKEQKTKREPAGEAKDKSSTSRDEAKDDGKRKDDSKTEAKKGDSSAKDEQSAKGDAKPSRPEDKDEKTAKGESKPDPDAEARKATKKDIDDLARSLKGKDSREREKAKRQLERIKKQADNLQTREKATETLEKGGAPDGTNENRNPTDGNASSSEPKNAGTKEDRSQRNSSSSSEKRGQKGTEIPEKIKKGSPFEPTNESKDGDRSPNRGSSDSKKGGKRTRSGEKNGKGFDVEPKNETKEGDGSPDSDSTGSAKRGENTGSGGKNGKGSSPSGDEQGSDSSDSSAGGNRPGGGGERRNGQGKAGDGSEGMDPDRKPAKPHAHRAAQMQLEEFAKKVNKDILKEAGVSEEAWKKYLESRRKQLTPPDQKRPEAPSAPQQGSQLPSMGGRTIQPAGSGPGDAHGPDRGQPPPGYRDPFREFTRQMSTKKN